MISTFGMQRYEDSVWLGGYRRNGVRPRIPGLVTMQQSLSRPIMLLQSSVLFMSSTNHRVAHRAVRDPWLVISNTTQFGSYFVFLEPFGQAFGSTCTLGVWTRSPKPVAISHP